MDDFIDEEFDRYVKETEHLTYDKYDELNPAPYFYSESTGFYISLDWKQIGMIEEDNKEKKMVIKELKNYPLCFLVCSYILEDAKKAGNLELLSNFEMWVKLKIIPINI